MKEAAIAVVVSALATILLACVTIGLFAGAKWGFLSATTSSMVSTATLYMHYRLSVQKEEDDDLR